MYSFPQLIKKIREEADLTQQEFADALGVSVTLISMVESGQREVSKKLVRQIAEKLKVHPSSITPFLFSNGLLVATDLPPMEKKLIEWGEQLQSHLIKEKAKLLKKYAT